MVRLVDKTVRFPQDHIVIDEFFGLISSGDQELSLCRIQCESGWSEPPQCPEFDEYVIVFTGELVIDSLKTGEKTRVQAGQAAFVPRGERIQYSTPEGMGADYFAICHPAFSLTLAHRESA